LSFSSIIHLCKPKSFFEIKKKGNLSNMKDESFKNGYQSVPVDWGINSDRKKQFFHLLKEISGKE